MRYTESFQVASGQGGVIWKTRALLDYIKEGYSITIYNFNKYNKHKVSKA